MASLADSDHPTVKIAHVLSMDVVGYSLLLITQQIALMDQLANIVKNTEQFRPTGT